LDELIQAKKDDESALLEKFRDLLNEKKVKIREQQRVIASASVDAIRPIKHESPQASGRGHSAEPSRAAKRKKAPVVVNDDESDDGFEKMDVDQQNDQSVDRGLESEDQQTTEAERTASDTESEVEASASSRPSVGKMAATRTAEKQPELNLVKQEPDSQKENPPPKRAIPFATRKTKAAATAPKAAASRPAAESDTDSDDEL
jgi:hypothetical protein